MKKQGSLILVMCVLFFGGLSLGFFLGRNTASSPVQVSVLSESTASTMAATEETAATKEETGLINVNTADQQTLMQLPGIGETLSLRIIDYREANGPFRTVEELIHINGIGQAKLEDLLPYATVGG